MKNEKVLTFKWSVSKGKDTLGYNICSLWINGKKVSSCCGGGYDMKGTALGNWMQVYFEKELLNLEIPMNRRNRENIQEYYGLTFHDPNFDSGKYIPKSPPVFGTEEDLGKTIEQLEQEKKSFGLERYQAFYRASSKIPTEKNIIPSLNGACGFSSMEKILNAVGYGLKYVNDGKYILYEKEKEQ